MDDLIVLFWQQVNQTLEQEILSTDLSDFLQHRVIQNVFYAADAHDPKFVTQLDYLIDHCGLDYVESILNDEPTFGSPNLHEFHPGLLCSANSIQMMYHIVYWQVETGQSLDDMAYVLEWGGGYGAMARIILKMVPDICYYLVDTPVVAQLQRRYLDAVLPKTCNWYVSDIVTFWENHYDVDLFISTWALSESSPQAVQAAAETTGIATADHALLAYQETQAEFAAAGDIVDILNQYRTDTITNVKPVSYSSGRDWYAVI